MPFYLPFLFRVELDGELVLLLCFELGLCVCILEGVCSSFLLEVRHLILGNFDSIRFVSIQKPLSPAGVLILMFIWEVMLVVDLSCDGVRVV